MTTTYASPATTDKDRVRLLIGDTGPTSYHLTDEEILDLLAIAGSGEGVLYEASAQACRAIAGRRAPATYAFASGPVNLDRDPVFRAWMDLAATFERRAREQPAAERIGWEDVDLADVETMIGGSEYRRDPPEASP